MRSQRKTKNLSLALAHLSDVHLGPLPPGSILGHISAKRLIGGASWYFRRSHLHLPHIANAICDSIHAAKPDHIAFTGDLVNIAAWNEFPPAAAWLKTLGTPLNLSMTPGNHDAYVEVPYERGLSHFAPWMQSDKKIVDAAFPFVKLRRNVSIIGANSACPQAYTKAGGTLGNSQLRDIAVHLEALGQQGFFRILMIHHPPLPGFAKSRKALTDAKELQNVLVEKGCEMVLHGHNHKTMLNWLETSAGNCPIIGVPSASMNGDLHHEAAAWNLFNIRRLQNRWQVEMVVNRWNSNTMKVESCEPAMLLPI